MDLPDGWIVFWKKREGDSRLLLSHPAEKQWVTTLALEAEHGRSAVMRLKALVEGQALSIGELGAVAAVNNVEVVLTLRAE